ncbi:MAG: family 10 glycosylhydrolase, partial [Candidatus Marinimicrobia bacterium]|nr:family 10 glycosylhydrolase [Candidatus Neomarinimicrobiota bacterium]
MKKIFYLVGLILYLTVRLFAEVPQEFRAVKITNVDSQVLFSDAAIAEALDYLASININTVLLVVWNGSGVNGVHTLYPSAVMDSLFGRKIHPSFSGRDPLITVLVEAHARGIEVLPWFEYGFATYHNTTYQENPDYILKAKPHWGLRTVDGKLAWKNNFYWMSAINPEVQAMIHDLTLEVCKNYDIDGIEYSDRIPAMPVEGGYDSITVSIYKEEHGGVRPPNDYENATWKRWRADKMNAWLQTVRDSVKAYDAHFNFSSSPSIYPWCYHEYLQDPYTWMNEEICDDIIPQLYRYTYEEYLTVLDASLQNYPNHHHAYFAGILMNVGDYLISEDYLLRALKANRDRGVNGEAFFFYEGLRKNNNQLGTLLKNTYY